MVIMYIRPITRFLYFSRRRRWCKISEHRLSSAYRHVLSHSAAVLCQLPAIGHKRSIQHQIGAQTSAITKELGGLCSLSSSEYISTHGMIGLLGQLTFLWVGLQEKHCHTTAKQYWWVCWYVHTVLLSKQNQYTTGFPHCKVVPAGGLVPCDCYTSRCPLCRGVVTWRFQYTAVHKLCFLLFQDWSIRAWNP